MFTFILPVFNYKSKTFNLVDVMAVTAGATWMEIWPAAELDNIALPLPLPMLFSCRRLYASPIYVGAKKHFLGRNSIRYALEIWDHIQQIWEHIQGMGRAREEELDSVQGQREVPGRAS